MPIKLPKGFQRRKSSGNALEEVQNPPGHSTFRVFERPGGAGKSIDAGQQMRASTESGPPPPSKRLSEGDDDLFSLRKPETANRYAQRSISSPALANKPSGSGGTDNTVSTAPYDSASVSTSMSYASTNPSSTSIRSIQKSMNSAERPYDDIPVPPTPKQRSGFLRGSGRTFSFGNKSQHDIIHTPAPPLPPPHTNFNERSLPALPDHGRDRSVTASSASTATPPKLFDSDLTLDSSELDGFSSMFDNIGRRSVVPSPSNGSLVGSALRHYSVLLLMLHRICFPLLLHSLATTCRASNDPRFLLPSISTETAISSHRRIRGLATTVYCVRPVRPRPC